MTHPANMVHAACAFCFSVAMVRTSTWLSPYLPWLLILASATPIAAAFTIGSPQQVGTITSHDLREVSGLVASRSHAEVFWVHNDSGDSARFLAMSRGGDLLGSFRLAGAAAIDWEDIAIGPKAGGGSFLYLGDVGDNNAVRANVAVHRVVEPVATTGGTIAAGAYQTLNFRYPNGARDVESIFVDPLADELYFITKRRVVPEVYSVPVAAFDSADGVVTLTAHGTFSTIAFGATAADISPDGRFILVRSTNPLAPARLYERLPGQSVVDALRSAGTLFTPGPEEQGEAIGWAANGLSFYTTSEFSGTTSAPIHHYAFTSTAPILAGDYNDDGSVDAADYTVWSDLKGSATSLPNETATLGSVTHEDYDVWRTHFGETSVGGAASIAVPEPVASSLLAAGLLMLAMPGSRRRVAACPGACT